MICRQLMREDYEVCEMFSVIKNRFQQRNTCIDSKEIEKNVVETTTPRALLW